MEAYNPTRLNWKERTRFALLLFFEQCLGEGRFSTLIEKQRRKFYERLHRRLQTGPDGTVEDIECISNLSSSKFKTSFFKKGRPVVFAGAAANWPCVQKWNLDYLSQQGGKEKILLVDVPGLTSTKEESNKRFEVLSVSDLVRDIKRGGDRYLRFSPLLQQRPELARDLDFEWLESMKSQFSIGNTFYLFVGGKGSVTHLHNDQPCNLFVQVHGRKKWTLFLPEDSHLLYPQVTQTAYFKSSLNLKDPDFERFPLGKNAVRLEVTLNPGDVLYVPPHVWHFVENQSDTIGVGYRFSSIPAAVRSSALFTFLRICAQNPPMWKTRKYGKRDTNLIWAARNGDLEAVKAKLDLPLQSSVVDKEAASRPFSI